MPMPFSLSAPEAPAAIAIMSPDRTADTITVPGAVVFAVDAPNLTFSIAARVNPSSQLKETEPAIPKEVPSPFAASAAAPAAVRREVWFSAYTETDDAVSNPALRIAASTLSISTFTEISPATANAFFTFLLLLPPPPPSREPCPVFPKFCPASFMSTSMVFCQCLRGMPLPALSFFSDDEPLELGSFVIAAASASTQLLPSDTALTCNAPELLIVPLAVPRSTAPTVTLPDVIELNAFNAFIIWS